MRSLKVLAICAVTLGGALVGLVGPAGPSAAGVTASASGSGHTSALGGTRTFAFSARQFGSGVAGGELEINFHPGETSPIPHIIVHADIDCLRVVGNIAIMSGTVKQTNFPAFENVRGILSVQDNGEGADAAPDLISGAAVGGGVIIVPPTSPLNCTNVTPPPDQPIDHGNVQVRSD